jgi:hypothetical protein
MMEENAKSAAGALSAAGHPAVLLAEQLGGAVIFHVVVGAFPTQAEALAAADRGIPGYALKVKQVPVAAPQEDIFNPGGLEPGAAYQNTRSNEEVEVELRMDSKSVNSQEDGGTPLPRPELSGE